MPVSMSYVKSGRYIVQEGDTLQSIAKKLFNDVHKAAAIAKANPEAPLEAGEVLEIPGFTGCVIVAKGGDQFPSLYRRVFTGIPTEATRNEFFRWNGRREIQEGEEVFFVDIRRKTYGY